MKHKLFIFFLGLFICPLVYAQGFDSWKDLHIYFKKSNFLPETITVEELNRLPILQQLPADFNELVDVTTKKKLFYLVILPIIYESNSLILEDRK